MALTDLILCWLQVKYLLLNEIQVSQLSRCVLQLARQQQTRDSHILQQQQQRDQSPTWPISSASNPPECRHKRRRVKEREKANRIVILHKGSARHKPVIMIKRSRMGQYRTTLDIPHHVARDNENKNQKRGKRSDFPFATFPLQIPFSNFLCNFLCNFLPFCSSNPLR